MARVLALWFVAAVIACMLNGAAGSWDHIVGGSKGWKIPKNASFYEDWAQARNFVVGDKLVFLFTTNAQNVIEVSEEDFEKCTQKNVINIYYKGPTILTLTKPGSHYYYCGIGTHCEAGQKLRINVADAASQ